MNTIDSFDSMSRTARIKSLKIDWIVKAIDSIKWNYQWELEHNNYPDEVEDAIVELVTELNKIVGC